jgi:hypothetical protein
MCNILHPTDTTHSQYTFSIQSTIDLLLFIRSRFTKMLKMSSSAKKYPHDHIWTCTTALYQSPRAVVNGSKRMKSALLRCIFILIMLNTLWVLSVSSRAKVVAVPRKLSAVIHWCKYFSLFWCGKTHSYNVSKHFRYTSYNQISHDIYSSYGSGIYGVIYLWWKHEDKTEFYSDKLSKNFHLKNRKKAGK